MERDPFDRDQGGSDVGRDLQRDVGDEPPAAIRDAAPDYLAPIDDTAPVSGHTPPPETSASAADTPEHDWEHAKGRVYPAFRPVGTQGEPVDSFDLLAATADGRSHTQPLIDEGPAGLPVVYAPRRRRVRRDRQRRPPPDVGDRSGRPADAAMGNLTTWSASAPGPTRSPANAVSSAPTPATAGMPPGSCCPTSSTT